MHVKINTANLNAVEVSILDEAARLVRMNFNPSTMPRVDRIKALAAALISECQDMKGDEDCDAREAAAAITHAQIASMLAVASATRSLG